MANEVKLPALGENVEGGDVIDVRVKPGDEVKEGQPLIEVEAEKSAVEVPSPFAGRVVQVLVKKGDKVGTGQTVVTIESNGKAATTPTTIRQAAETKQAVETAKAAPPKEDGTRADGMKAKPQA